MTHFYGHILSGENICLVKDGKITTIQSDHPSFNEILTVINSGEEIDYVQLYKLADTKEAILQSSDGKLKVVDGAVVYGETELHGSLASHLLRMLNEKEPVTGLIKFLDNLMENPSNRSVSELYNFLTVNNLPLTDDGCFMAYKGIKEDYTDCYTGKISNKVGEVVKMQRNMVDDDSTRTCSHGLHVCSHEYLSSWGYERLMLVKINPAHVVSIPHDYNFSKMRVESYTVLAEIDKEKADLNVLNDRSVYRNALPFAVGQTVKSNTGTKYTVTAFDAEATQADAPWTIEDGQNRSFIMRPDGTVLGFDNEKVLGIVKVS